MSTANARQPTDKQQRIIDYLRQNAQTKTYFKSWRIGEALGLSAKEVGTNMARIANQDNALQIQQWGYSSGTTWKVSRG